MIDEIKMVILLKDDIKTMVQKHQPDLELFYLTLLSVTADVAMANGLSLDEYLECCANIYQVKGKPINEEIH
jgi:hypothetical protein